MDARTARYQRLLRELRDAVGDEVVRRWLALGTYNEDDVSRFVASVLPLVAAGQSKAAALSDAYLSQRLGVRPIGVNASAVSGAAVRNGTSPADVYRRPFVEVWTALKDGSDLGAAIEMGRGVAHSSALMDVALATMATYVNYSASYNDGVDSDGQIVAWQRVAEPGCCEFCLLLDGVHTGPDQPQPLHNRCGCTATPILRKSGFRLKTTAGPGYEKSDVLIREHGELGPVITDGRDHFTTEAEIDDGAGE